MPAEEPKKRRFNLVVPLVLVILLAGGGAAYYFLTRGKVSTDDAYVDGHVFVVTPRVQGYVTRVMIEDNQMVAQGDPLLTLDPTEYEVNLAQAKAALAADQATLTSLEMGVPLERSQTEQRVAAAQAQVASLEKSLERLAQEEQAAGEEVKRTQAVRDQALLDLERFKTLAAKGATAQSALDTARTNARTSEALFAAAQAKLKTVVKQRASVEADLEGLKANVRLAATGEEVAVIKARQVAAQQDKVRLSQALVRQAELNLSYTTIVAPAAGRVTQRSIEPGRMVSRGQPVLAVVPLDLRGLWVTANLKETQLTRVRPGQRVEIKVDAYPGLRLKGRVESIMAGTGAAFSLFPPENATGSFVKVVQRVPVRIALEPEAGADLPPLRLGLSVVPTIFLTDRP